MTDDEVVAHEVERLRSFDDPVSKLKADLLEQAQVPLAAAFLRECALAALAQFNTSDGAWAVSAHLQFIALQERRRMLNRFPPERLAGT